LRRTNAARITGTHVDAGPHGRIGSPTDLLELSERQPPMIDEPASRTVELFRNSRRENE